RGDRGAFELAIAQRDADPTALAAVDADDAHPPTRDPAALPRVARDDVGRGLSLRIPDLEAGARRIRKHVEDVFLRPAIGRARRFERLALVRMLPASEPRSPDADNSSR